jgi:sugar lactone lactonase YvrE
MALCSNVSAQTAHFSGAKFAVSSGFTRPYGVAVDRSGNVFVTDPGNSKVYEIVAVSGSVSINSTVNIIGSGFLQPLSVVVDGSGNVFVADYGNSKVYEIVAVGGVVSSASAVNIVGSNFSDPEGVAVDGSGNVFVADMGNSAVKEIVASGGVVTSASAVHIVGSGFSNPSGVEVDGSGNVFVADFGNNEVKEIVASGGVVTSASAVHIVGSGFSNPSGVAVDGSGNVFVADMGNNEVKEITTSANYGSVNVGSSSSPISLNFVFDTAGPIGVPVVVTQGATGLDFADATTGTCSTNGTGHTYNLGETCTVDVIFTPKYAGVRFGAAQLQDRLGNLLATGFVYGSGLGAQAAFLPGTKSLIHSSTLNYPTGVAVDAFGNTYIADTYNHRVLKESPSAVESTVASQSSGSALGNPTGIAVDGAGTVYIADGGTALVLIERPVIGGGGYNESVFSSQSMTLPTGVAVDGNGNLYIADGQQNVVLKETLQFGGGYTESVVANNLYNPTGVAVDASGNIYIADTVNSQVMRVPWTGSGYGTPTAIPASTPIALNFPIGVSVDAGGNVYIADSGDNRIMRSLCTASGCAAPTPIITDLWNPTGVTVDGKGNVYFANLGSNEVFKVDFANPPSLNFAATNVGSRSTDSPQSVTVANVGTTAFTFSAMTPPADFIQMAGGGATIDCANNESVSTNAICNLSIAFEPQSTGVKAEPFGLTANTLPAMQSIALSGTASPEVPALSFAAIAAQAYGNAPFTVSATSASSGVVTYAVVSGPATISGATVTLTGVGTVTLSASQAASGNYAVATTTTSFTVNSAAVSLSFAAIPVQIYGNAPFTVSATSASSGAVTYAVVSGPATISGSTVTLTGAGTVLLSASQAASGNFAAATTTTSFQAVTDFSVSSPVSGSGSGTSQTTTSGGTATFTLDLTPSIGTTLPMLTTLTVSGMPSGVTATITPASWTKQSASSWSLPANTALGAVSMTFQLPSATARLDHPDQPGQRLPPLLWGILLLPFAGRMRRAAKRLNRTISILLFLAAGIVTLAGISGCSSNGGSSTKQTQTYTMVETVTSGTLSHSTVLTLTVD